MKNLKSVSSGVVVAMLSISGVQAATYDADYGSVDRSSTTTYTADVTAVTYDTNLALAGEQEGSYTTYSNFLDAGSDDLLASGLLGNSGSNDAGEERAFFQAVTGADLNAGIYTTIDSDSGFSVDVDGETGLSTLTVDPSYADGYFMLKFGNADSLDSHWIFQNNSPLNTFVWLSSISYQSNNGGQGSILGLSHFSYEPCVGDECGLTPPISTVPVPAAVWLFGSALLGLMGVSRKKRNIA